MSRNRTEKKLTPKQVKAIESLLLGQSVTQAARAAGCGKSTLYAWLKLPTFAGELQRLEGLGLQQLGRQLMTLSTAAAVALQDALHKDMPVSARLRAAAIVCERGPALAELSALLARVEALERKAAEHE
jgi:hypothetical protein